MPAHSPHLPCPAPAPQITPVPGAGVNVTFTVRNVGARDGREVPQLYVTFPPTAGEPPRSLRGFAAVDLPQVSR